MVAVRSADGVDFNIKRCSYKILQWPNLSAKVVFIESLLKSFSIFEIFQKTDLVWTGWHIWARREHIVVRIWQMPKARIKWRLCGQRPAFQASVPTVGDIPHYSKVKVPSHISDGRAFYPVLTSPITANAPGNEAIFKPKLVVRLSLYENYCFDVKMWRQRWNFLLTKQKQRRRMRISKYIVSVHPLVNCMK